MSFESNLRYFYDTSPNELQKSFNLEVSTRQLIFQAVQNTTDEKVIQIIGTLIANYVELNHSKIDQELKRELENHAWIVLSTTQAQNPAVYVFYAQILANILFNFYEQSWSDEFIQKVQSLIQMKPESGFVVLEEIIRRLKPNDDSHKDSMISFDSRYRAIKNLFYKQHLNKLIDMILYCLKYPEIINQSLNIFLLILEIEFVTDTRTKDWHILKAAEIKNILSLEFQLKECKLQLLENNILERILQQNSNNPFSNQLGYLWVKVRDTNFIQFIVDLVPHYPQAHKILKKICKIFKKHFRGETTQINHMTIRLQQITGFHKGQFLSLAGKTLFASCDINWVHYNLQLMDVTCIIEAFKFMRDLCRIARSQDYTSLAYLLMPKIINLYETAIKTSLIDRKPMKYSAKVISSLMIQQYLEYFYEQIVLAQNLFEGELAFEFLYIGLLASMSATSYQLDYVNKIKFIKEDRMLYPVNVQLFKSFDYVSFYRQWLSNAYNVSVVLAQQSGKPSIFIYKLWKKLLNPQTNIQYQNLIGDISNLYLNLSQVVTFDLKYIIKGLILILNSTIRWKSETSFEINRIEVPVSSIEKFYQLDIVINPKVGQHYYTIQSKFVNAQCDWLQDVDSMILLKQHFSKQVFDLAQKMTQDHQILFFTSLLKEQGSSSYVEIMKTFQSENLFDSFLNYRVSYSALLKLSISMINDQQVNKLNSQIVNSIYKMILNLSDKLIWFLQSKYDDQQKERQVKRQQKENYKEYYKPLISALRLFEKTRALNKAQCTHIEYKERIPIFIFRILDLIIIDDLAAYIHKMCPLFELIKQIMIAKSWAKVMDTSNLITIVKFIDQAIQIQERKTLSLSLEILNDIMSEKELVMKNDNMFHHIIIQCLNLSFIYNQFVKQVSQIVLRYVIQFPQNYDILFLKELPKQINIQEEIVNIYVSKVNLIKEFIPISISKQAERDFQDYFVQLQILCCYYI